MSDLDERLNTAIALRNQLSAEVQRIQGRKEAADQALAAVGTEIRGRNLNPDTLPDTLQTLTLAYEKEVASFEVGLAQAQTLLNPYLETP